MEAGGEVVERRLGVEVHDVGVRVREDCLEQRPEPCLRSKTTRRRPKLSLRSAALLASRAQRRPAAAPRSDCAPQRGADAGAGAGAGGRGACEIFVDGGEGTARLVLARELPREQRRVDRRELLSVAVQGVAPAPAPARLARRRGACARRTARCSGAVRAAWA